MLLSLHRCCIRTLIFQDFLNPCILTYLLSHIHIRIRNSECIKQETELKKSLTLYKDTRLRNKVGLTRDALVPTANSLAPLRCMTDEDN